MDGNSESLSHFSWSVPLFRVYQSQEPGTHCLPRTASQLSSSLTWPTGTPLPLHEEEGGGGAGLTRTSSEQAGGGHRMVSSSHTFRPGR